MVLPREGKLRGLIAKAMSKPADIVFFKIAQRISNLLHYRLKIWSLYERCARRRWNRRTAEAFRDRCGSSGEQIIGESGIEAVRRFFQLHPDELVELRFVRDDIVSGKIEIFGHPVHFQGLNNIKWCTDWRYDHTWPRMYFRSYNYYQADKQAPYDVKFPWELNRMNFLMIPTLLAAADDDEAWWPLMERALESWQKDNPIASSINWHPMECSMRAVNLALLAMLCSLSKRPALSALQRVLQLCEVHGRFIYRAIEYTDVRGNHYAANLAAMSLLGILLRDFVPEARRWAAYAQKHIDEEIFLQYSKDGVQFEKSIPYHRLVTQLLMVSLIAGEKAGLPVSEGAKERLRQACYYAKSYTRPDGLAPSWGDNDDARALWFDKRSLRDHRGLLSLGAAFFDDPALAPDVAGIDVPVLLGAIGERTACSDASAVVDVRYLDDGGMFCARFRNDHFIADVGEIGLKGRGGHGHHDSLSFELTLDGAPLIVDPGSYVYTGDPKARNYFRSTHAHNVARVDGEEMGTLIPESLFRLGAEATPFDVVCTGTDQGFELSAAHDGYKRLHDPVRCLRRWYYDAPGRALTIVDGFGCNGGHEVERFFHFAPDLRLVIQDEELHILASDDRKFLATWDRTAKAVLRPDWISENYGGRTAGKTLVLTNRVTGSRDELSFKIRMALK